MTQGYILIRLFMMSSLISMHDENWGKNSQFKADSPPEKSINTTNVFNHCTEFLKMHLL